MEGSNMDVNSERRRFVKGSATAAIAAALPITATADELTLESHHRPNDERYWNKVKKQFALDRRSVYMNTGSTGSMPKKVLSEFDQDNRLVAQDPYSMGGKFGSFPYVSDMRETVATGLGANADEVVLTRNTTDGLCSIVGGLQFEAGDVVLTTHHEHVGLLSPLHVVSDRVDIEVIELEIPVDQGDNSVTVEDYVQVFTDAVALYGSRVRLIAFSHITYKTGTTLPVQQICQQVAIPNAIPTLIDGAHGVGMLNLDMHQLDCDFYAGPGHKWQCGPGATGILYIRDNANRLKQFWSDRSQPLHMINSSWGAYDHLGAGWQMQYVGNDHYPAKQALANSCQMWDEIGRARIEQRVLSLSALCKSELARHFPNSAVFSPDVEGLTSGLTSFNPFNDVTDGELLGEFRDRLKDEYGFIIRTTDFPLKAGDLTKTYALRISTHIYNSSDDVKGLVRAMKSLYREMA